MLDTEWRLKNRDSSAVDGDGEVADRLHGLLDDADPYVAGLWNAGEDAVSRLELPERVRIPWAASCADEAIADHVVPVPPEVFARRVVEVLAVPGLSRLLLAGCLCSALRLRWVDQPAAGEVLGVAILEVLEEHYVQR